jgi:hypothetical protein
MRVRKEIGLVQAGRLEHDLAIPKLPEKVDVLDSAQLYQEAEHNN